MGPTNAGGSNALACERRWRRSNAGVGKGAAMGSLTLTLGRGQNEPPECGERWRTVPPLESV
jgi:hypothetical protein